MRYSASLLTVQYGMEDVVWKCYEKLYLYMYIHSLPLRCRENQFLSISMTVKAKKQCRYSSCQSQTGRPLLAQAFFGWRAVASDSSFVSCLVFRTPQSRRPPMEPIGS